MKTKTFKCVQCGECMVQADGKPLNNAKQSRTGCVLFHDQRTRGDCQAATGKGPAPSAQTPVRQKAAFLILRLPSLPLLWYTGEDFSERRAGFY